VDLSMVMLVYQRVNFDFFHGFTVIRCNEMP
jgi:hypothetical protein